MPIQKPLAGMRFTSDDPLNLYVTPSHEDVDGNDDGHGAIYISVRRPGEHYATFLIPPGYVHFSAQLVMGPRSKTSHKIRFAIRRDDNTVYSRVIGFGQREDVSLDLSGAGSLTIAVECTNCLTRVGDDSSQAYFSRAQLTR